MIHDTDRNGINVSSVVDQITGGNRLIVFDETTATKVHYYTVVSSVDNGPNYSIYVN